MFNKEKKVQPALEFLSVYSWAFIFLVVSIAVLVVLANVNKNIAYPPSKCFLTQSLVCQRLYVMSNSLGTYVLIIFTNNLGEEISFPNNAFEISPTYANQIYYGQCYPTNAVVTSTVSCNAAISSYKPPIGAVLTPRFTISYKICGTSCSGSLSVYNTSGTSTVTVSLYQYPYQILSVSASSGGKVNPLGSGNYILGSSVTLYETANTGYYFSGWSGSGTGTYYTGSSPNPSVVINGPITETASFLKSTYNLQVTTRTGGTVSPSPGFYSESYGATPILYAVPSSGWAFLSWTCSGACTSSDTESTSNTITLSAITGGIVETANFQTYAYSLQVATGSGGTVSPTPGVYGEANGATPTIYANPNAEYTFSSWTCTNGVSSSACTAGDTESSSSALTLSAITGNIIETAAFAPTCQGGSTVFGIGSTTTYTVPTACGHALIQAWGGGGAGSAPFNGAGAGYISGSVAVTPGSTLYIYVGGGGSAGTGGGGCSAVGTSSGLSSAFVVAAGGGGAGSAPLKGGGSGGAGGGTSGTSAVGGGGGASQTSGGYAGNGGGATAGSSFQGGVGGFQTDPNGGSSSGGEGGCGIYGGGGGGATASCIILKGGGYKCTDLSEGGGGGASSNTVSMSNLINTGGSGVNAGNPSGSIGEGGTGTANGNAGEVIITWST